MEYLIVAAVAFGVGAFVSYLFLRANPNKKRAVDKFVDEHKP